MTRLITMVMGLLLVATAAPALISQDQCLPECDTHQLEWRPIPTDPWASVGAALSVTDVSHPSQPAPFRGAEWTGLSSFGDFRATATRGNDVSPYSPILELGEPPAAPLLLAGLLTLAWLRRRSVGEIRAMKKNALREDEETRR